MRRARQLVVLTVLVLIPALAVAYNGIEHAWIGLQTFDFWRDFDRGFYDTLEGSNDIPWQRTLFVRKFYLIGCMLPDLEGMEGMGSNLEGVLPKRPWLVFDGPKSPGTQPDDGLDVVHVPRDQNRLPRG